MESAPIDSNLGVGGRGSPLRSAGAGPLTKPRIDAPHAATPVHHQRPRWILEHGRPFVFVNHGTHCPGPCQLTTVSGCTAARVVEASRGNHKKGPLLPLARRTAPPTQQRARGVLPREEITPRWHDGAMVETATALVGVEVGRRRVSPLRLRTGGGDVAWPGDHRPDDARHGCAQALRPVPHILRAAARPPPTAPQFFGRHLVVLFRGPLMLKNNVGRARRGRRGSRSKASCR